MNSTPSAKDVYLHLDIHKVDQVVRNLITNAVITFATGVFCLVLFLVNFFFRLFCVDQVHSCAWNNSLENGLGMSISIQHSFEGNIQRYPRLLSGKAYLTKMVNYLL